MLSLTSLWTIWCQQQTGPLQLCGGFALESLIHMHGICTYCLTCIRPCCRQPVWPLASAPVLVTILRLYAACMLLTIACFGCHGPAARVCRLHKSWAADTLPLRLCYLALLISAGMFAMVYPSMVYTIVFRPIECGSWCVGLSAQIGMEKNLYSTCFGHAPENNPEKMLLCKTATTEVAHA